MHHQQQQRGRGADAGTFSGRWALAFGGVVVAAVACGPSVQSIYEGNIRFEHCYRLDLELDAAPTHREACWKEWLGTYTYGQPRDRIDYARRRAHAFATGDSGGPTLNIGDARKPETRAFYLVVPSPTSGHAPPPPIATRWYSDAGAPPPAASAAAATSAPGDQCADACRETLSQCQGGCPSDAGAPSAKCKACDSDYTACMKRCFH